MISKIKKNYKVLIIGIGLGILISGIGVYATTKLSSSEVLYDNSKSGGASSNVQGALEELYRKSDSCSSNICYKDNIVIAYTYDATTCLTGEEKTCIINECYQNKTKGSCPNGTIIGYKVNEKNIKYFHVIHDDGETITMQQRETTVYNDVWYDTNDNTKGPLIMLQKLEDATKDWTNVNPQTYTMGATNFNGTNAYTGCSSYDSCTTNTYTLGKRTARARMITVQEATNLGCTKTTNSCPNYMSNYLYQSTNSGGTVDDNTITNNQNIYGYWTMSASSSNNSNVWTINNHRSFDNHCIPTDMWAGSRAIVVINK